MPARRPPPSPSRCDREHLVWAAECPNVARFRCIDACCLHAFLSPTWRVELAAKRSSAVRSRSEGTKLRLRNSADALPSHLFMVCCRSQCGGGTPRGGAGGAGGSVSSLLYLSLHACTICLMFCHRSRLGGGTRLGAWRWRCGRSARRWCCRSTGAAAPRWPRTNWPSGVPFTSALASRRSTSSACCMAKVDLVHLSAYVLALLAAGRPSAGPQVPTPSLLLQARTASNHSAPVLQT